MEEKIIRKIRPNEIEIRLKGFSKDKQWATWLLYKTARVDAAVLTETYGAFGWQNKFERIGNTLFCSIGIQDPKSGSWIWKSDAGDITQIEGVKGEASDAFKRAGFKWGIGAQLYNAPDIILDSKYKYVEIKEIEIDDEKVTKLVLTCKGEEVFRFPKSYTPKNTVKPVEPKLEVKQEVKPAVVNPEVKPEVKKNTDVVNDPQYQRLLADAAAINVNMEELKKYSKNVYNTEVIPAGVLQESINRKKDYIAKQAIETAKNMMEAKEC